MKTHFVPFLACYSKKRPPFSQGEHTSSRESVGSSDWSKKKQIDKYTNYICVGVTVACICWQGCFYQCKIFDAPIGLFSCSPCIGALGHFTSHLCGKPPLIGAINSHLFHAGLLMLMLMPQRCLKGRLWSHLSRRGIEWYNNTMLFERRQFQNLFCRFCRFCKYRGRR